LRCASLSLPLRMFRNLQLPSIFSQNKMDQTNPFFEPPFILAESET
jgi:hypothetical protein